MSDATNDTTPRTPEQTLRRARELLLFEAEVLRDSSTDADGDWGDEQVERQMHDEMLSVARELGAMVHATEDAPPPAPEVIVGPVQLVAKVSVVTGDGRMASVDVDLAPGKPPSRAHLLAAIGRVLASQPVQALGARLMHCDEFFNDVCVSNVTGGRRGNFAVPRDFSFDAAAVTAAAAEAVERERAELEATGHGGRDEGGDDLADLEALADSEDSDEEDDL